MKDYKIEIFMQPRKDIVPAYYWVISCFDENINLYVHIKHGLAETPFDAFKEASFEYGKLNGGKN